MFDKKIIYFFAVVEESSFSAAAKRLFISQPALSYQIALLEEELGLNLFDRKKNRATLNKNGQEFYRECKKLHLEFEKIYQKFQQYPKNEIRIGFTGAFENRELLELISQFKEIYPSVTFSFIKNTFEGCVNDLLEDKVDVSFGIKSTYRDLEPIQVYLLYDYEICIICSPKHPLSHKNSVSLDELKNEDFILLSKNFGHQFFDDMMNSFRRSNFTPRIKREVQSFDELIFYVSSNDGIGIAAPNVIRSEEVRTIKLLDSNHKSSYVVAQKKNISSPVLTSFIDFTLDYFKTIN